MEIQANLTRAPIHQVVGLIPGAVEPDRWVIVGCHRDAWSLGAMDPGSGTLTLLNAARGLGKLLANGWQPRRSILLVSHDAEEQGLVGSFEWVEQHFSQLLGRGVAYLNMDTAVNGRDTFWPRGTPTLQRLIHEVASAVPAPADQVAQGRAKVIDMWPDSDSLMAALGSGSDYAGFQQHAGLACAEARFIGNSGYSGVYHSAYDSYYWMEHFGDPDFTYHRSISTVLALMALRLADDVLLPFDYQFYPVALRQYAANSQRQVSNISGAPSFDFAPLYQAIDRFQTAANALDAEIRLLLAEPSPSAAQLRSINDRLIFTERTFINFPRSGRGWYSHALFSPGRYDSYSSDAFPVLTDAIHDRDWNEVAFQIKMLTTILISASETLSSSLLVI